MSIDGTTHLPIRFGRTAVRKDASGTSTEYVIFGRNIIAQRNPATDDWSDYIFAKRQVHSRADNYITNSICTEQTAPTADRSIAASTSLMFRATTATPSRAETG
jgi:hypothetical protein